jgi:hypothetical protein
MRSPVAPTKFQSVGREMDRRSVNSVPPPLRARPPPARPCLCARDLASASADSATTSSSSPPHCASASTDFATSSSSSLHLWKAPTQLPISALLTSIPLMAMATMDATTLTALLKEAVAAFSTRRAVVVPGRLELTHAALDTLIDATTARLAADAEFLPATLSRSPSPTPSRFVSFFRIRSVMFLPTQRRAPE